MLSVVLCVCAALACAAPGVTPSRWDTADELPLWIERPNVPPDVVEMVRSAARSWSRGSGGVLRFKDAAEFPSGGIRVRFVRDDENFGEAAPYLDGATGRIVACFIRRPVWPSLERPDPRPGDRGVRAQRYESSRRVSMELVVGAAERPLLIEQARLLVGELESRHVTGQIFAETPEAVVVDMLRPRTDRAMLEEVVDLVRRTCR